MEAREEHQAVDRRCAHDSFRIPMHFNEVRYYEYVRKQRLDHYLDAMLHVATWVFLSGWRLYYRANRSRGGKHQAKQRGQILRNLSHPR